MVASGLFRELRCQQDQYLQKVFRVDRGYTGGEATFGKVGTCTYAHYDDQEISIMDDQMSILRVPVSEVIQMTVSIPKPKAIMTFEHVAKKVKFQMLGRLGMVSPESAPPLEDIKGGPLVEGQTIQVWSVLLEHTFPHASFFSWSPESMFAYFHRVQSGDEEG